MILDGHCSTGEAVPLSYVELAVMSARAYLSLIYGGTTDSYASCKVVRWPFVSVDTVAACPNICGMMLVVGMSEGVPDNVEGEGRDSVVVTVHAVVWGSFDLRSSGRLPGIDATPCYGCDSV